MSLTITQSVSKSKSTERKITAFRIGQGELQDISQIILADKTSTRWEHLFEAPSIFVNYLSPLLNDKRDLPMVHVLFNILALVLPSAVALFCLPINTTWYVLATVYLVTLFLVFLKRFVLWLHFSAHRKTYNKASRLGRFLNNVCTIYLSPFFGIPPGCYYLHHCVMHHCENNLFPYDVSSTEPYNRGNFLHFLWYYCRYWTALWFQLPYYAFKKSRFDLMKIAIVGESVYLAIWYMLYQVNPTATIFVCIVPFFTVSFLLMFGNFSQHIFVDPANSRSNYGLTMNVINCPDNMSTFNDGYHIIHHINSKTHWTDLPDRFLETLAKHKSEGAFIFNGLGFFEVGVLVFLRQFGVLADRMIQLGKTRRSRQELINLLKGRLVPIDNAVPN